MILIDRLTEGLAPMVVQPRMEPIQEIRRRGVSVLLVEQELTMALQIADKLYVTGHGRIVHEGMPAELHGNERVRKEWLEVT